MRSSSALHKPYFYTANIDFNFECASKTSNATYTACTYYIYINIFILVWKNRVTVRLTANETREPQCGQKNQTWSGLRVFILSRDLSDRIVPLCSVWCVRTVGRWRKNRRKMAGKRWKIALTVVCIVRPKVILFDYVYYDRFRLFHCQCLGSPIENSKRTWMKFGSLTHKWLTNWI